MTIVIGRLDAIFVSTNTSGSLGCAITAFATGMAGNIAAVNWSHRTGGVFRSCFISVHAFGNAADEKGGASCDKLCVSR